MKKYDDLFDALIGDTHTNYFLKKLREEFTPEFKNLIFDIKENGHKYSLEKWLNIFEKYKKSEAMLIALCKSESCPQKIIDKISNNLVSDYGRELTPILLGRENITDEQIKNILGSQKYAVNSLFPEYDPSHPEYLPPIPIKTADRLIKICYEEYGIDMKLPMLTYFSNKEYIDKILNEHSEYEPIKDALVNNIYLTDDERDVIFDIGCDRKKVLRPTNYMLTTMYRESVEAYFENDYKTATTIEEKRALENAHYDGHSFLLLMMRKQLLNDDMQLDLMNRLSHNKDRSQNPILSELLKTTKNENILRIAETSVVSRDKEYIFTNPHCPLDLLYRKTYDYIKKIDNAFKKGKPMSDNWSLAIESMIDRLNLSPDYESVLLCVRNKQLHLPLARAPYTSFETLDRIANDNTNSTALRTIALINKELQTNGIYGDELKKYMSIVGNEFTIANILRNFNPSYLSNRKEMVKTFLSNIESLEKIFYVLKNLENNIHPEMKTTLKFYNDSIQYLLLQEKEYDGSTLEKTNTEKLKEMNNETVRHIQKYCNAYDAIFEIEKKVDEFNKIKNIIQSRTTDIIFEEMQKQEER